MADMASKVNITVITGDHVFCRLLLQYVLMVHADSVCKTTQHVQLFIHEKQVQLKFCKQMLTDSHV